jgi:hypothetical protein
MNLSLKAILLLAVVSTYCLSVNAQNNSNDLIAASQSVSSLQKQIFHQLNL